MCPSCCAAHLIVLQTAVVKLCFFWLKPRKPLTNWCEVPSKEGAIQGSIVFRIRTRLSIHYFPSSKERFKLIQFRQTFYLQWSRTTLATRKQLWSSSMLLRLGSVVLVNMLTILQYAGLSISSYSGVHRRSYSLISKITCYHFWYRCLAPCFASRQEAE